MRFRVICVLLGLWASAVGARADNEVAQGVERVRVADFQSIVVYPPQVKLESGLDRQQIVVIATDAQGLEHDVTTMVSIDIDNRSLISVSGHTIVPRADGGAEVTVSIGDLQVQVPVVVSGAGVWPPPSFRLDVIPVFTSAGCNTGSCHGSARGQDGFRLSLFGFDPAGDYQRITRELPGRRVDLAFAEKSLLGRKATGRVPHTGGELFDTSDPRYKTLIRWIEDGARDDAADVVTVIGIELSPGRIVTRAGGSEFRMLVRATYSDGTNRDVTGLAVFRTNNDVSVKVIGGGLVRTGEPGEAFITASFSTFTVGTPMIVVDASRAFDYADAAQTQMPANYIDDLIEAKLRAVRVKPSGICTDEVFVRRVYLDIAGVLPTTQEVGAFLADINPRKRALLIDSLLERKEFAEIWVMQWAELLQIRSNNRISEKAALLYFEWVRDAIASNMPVDEMVRRILTATGGTFSEPATNFYQNQNDTKVLAENVAQAFMGIRVQCAQCHNHPFDRWTQNDYYSFSAFFTQIGRKKAQDPRETIVFNSGSGEIKHPVTGQVMPPKPLGGEAPNVAGRDRRVVFAQWLTSTENPQFSRSLANRVWAHFMGRGIVEPVDDFRVSNPAANGPLLDALGERLTEYGYDFKALVRDICNSRAYQRSTEINETNGSDDRNFSRAWPRRLRAEVLLDIVCQVTEDAQKFKGLPLGERAVRIADGTTSNYFLKTFGRSTRETVAACEVSLDPSLSQALHLLNGETISRKVTRGGVVARLLEQGQSPEQVVTELYRRCLSRSPTVVEVEAIIGQVDGNNAQAVLEDLFWALLNAQEFVFNH
jgi:uncharacterized protein DUF1549/uncharacterized protein DUF1553